MPSPLPTAARAGHDRRVRPTDYLGAARALRRLVPGVRAADLRYHHCGIRAQAVFPDGRLADDFVIEEGERSVHVLNAPSPAATAPAG